MSNKKNEYDMVIVLSDIVYLIKKRLVWIILTIAIFSSGGYYFSASSYIPLYYATSSLVVNPTQSEDTSAVINISDINLAKSLVPTYTQILRSNKVMDYVIDELGLGISKSELQSYIGLSVIADTQILLMTVTCPDPQLAIDISNAIAAVAPKALTETLNVGTVHVLDAAFISGTVENRVVRETVTAGVIGFGVSFILIFLWNMMSAKVRKSSDADELELPVLVDIAHVKGKQAKRDLHLSSPAVPPTFVESFMILGAIADHLMSAQRIKKLMVSSALESEGKSMTAVNLSMALANSGKNVLLIDCDLRKPSIHEILHVDRGEVSTLYGYFEYESGIKNCIKEIYPGFSVIPFVSQIDKRHVLFRSRNFIRTIDQLAKNYDYVIFDTAPMYDVNDSMNLADLVDGVLMVIKQEKATIKLLKKVIHNLRRIDAKIIGCVLNDVKHVKERASYSKKYRYYDSAHYKNQAFAVNEMEEKQKTPYIEKHTG